MRDFTEPVLWTCCGRLVRPKTHGTGLKQRGRPQSAPAVSFSFGHKKTAPVGMPRSFLKMIFIEPRHVGGMAIASKRAAVQTASLPTYVFAAPIRSFTSDHAKSSAGFAVGRQRSAKPNVVFQQRLQPPKLSPCMPFDVLAGMSLISAMPSCHWSV